MTPGDVVCLMLPSSIKFAACYLGALRAGAITSAINLRLGAGEKASILERTSPVVTVVGDGVELADDVDAGHRIHVSELGHAFGAAPPQSLPELSPTDAACIVWTSGTTGAAEGRGVRPRRAWRRSRATSASSPRPATAGSSCCRSRTSGT